MQKMHKMKPKTPIPIVKVDYTKKAWEQTTTALHNRWHPDLPVVRTLISCDLYCQPAAVQCTVHLTDTLNTLLQQICITLVPSLMHNWLATGQVGSVKEGDVFRVETVEWTGGLVHCCVKSNVITNGPFSCTANLYKACKL